MKVAVASGKGGTGKTFVSTNLFHILMSKGISVSLTDCDAEVPNAMLFFSAAKYDSTDVMQYFPVIDAAKCTLCGKCAEYCTYNAIFIAPELNKIRLLEDLCHGCGACEIACSRHAIRESYKITGRVSSYKIENKECFIEGRMLPGISSPVPVIKQAIKCAEKLKADFLIMDAPAGTSCPFIQTVVQADYVILVTEPTPFGFNDLHQAAETLRTMNKPFGVIVNRAGVGDSSVYRYLEIEKIALLAEIPFDKEIARLYSKGIIVSERMPEIRQVFENLTDKVQSYGNSDNQR